MSDFTHHYKLKILEHHLDTYGHVNNATYLQLYEEARWDMFDAQGYGLNKVRIERVGPVILNISINYKRELNNREDIIINSKFDKIKNRLSWYFSQEMILLSSGQLISDITILMGLMDLTKRKLISMPDDWKRVLGLEFV